MFGYGHFICLLLKYLLNSESLEVSHVGFHLESEFGPGATGNHRNTFSCGQFVPVNFIVHALYSDFDSNSLKVFISTQMLTTSPMRNMSEYDQRVFVNFELSILCRYRIMGFFSSHKLVTPRYIWDVSRTCLRVINMILSTCFNFVWFGFCILSVT